MPQSCTCDNGKYLVMGEEDCKTCLGTGRDLNSDLWSEPCRAGCNNGRVTYCRTETCPTCNGTGYIW